MKNIFPLILIIGFFASKIAAQPCLQVTECIATSCDYSDNDPIFWNGLNYWDPIHSQHDLSEGEVDLSIALTDFCGDPVPELSYLLLLDMDGDGMRETAVTDDLVLPSGFISVGNANLPNYAGGNLLEFDHRPVLPQWKNRFVLVQSGSGNTRTASIRWAANAFPNDYALPKLPAGNHRILWNIKGSPLCDQSFEVRDCKQPTVVCINNLAVNIMPTNFIQLWASDFLQYAEDNATPGSQIEIGIRKTGTGTGFPIDANGQTTMSVVFACHELGQQPVELWARDKAGNASYCETFIIVQDPFGNCTGAGSVGDMVACAQNPLGHGIEAVEFHLDCDQPPVSQIQLSTDDGCAYISNIPDSTSCTVTPSKDDHPLNGVTTFDLVLTSMHILGIAPFNSPYKIIAADVNCSGSVTTFDIVESRKLILGIYAELPNCPSWRFVRADYVFPNPANPFASQFPANAPVMAGDTVEFIGVKAGDVNFSAVVNNIVGNDTDDRATTSFSIENQALSSGETALVPVHASENGAWLGFQFSLGFDPAQIQIEEVIPHTLPDMAANNFAQPRPGQLNASWNTQNATDITSGTPLFYLKIKALQPVQLREALKFNLTSGISNLASEVYDATTARQPLSLVFREKTAPLAVPQLSNLQPNPATDAAFFTLQLPEAASVRLEIFDLAGRQLRSQTADFQAGTSRVEVPVRDLPSGPLAYRVTAAGQTWSGRFVKK
ncbi:MAG: T9SS type A sorting domain-containing protein [Saprospiraceae bacterium]